MKHSRKVKTARIILSLIIGVFILYSSAAAANVSDIAVPDKELRITGAFSLRLSDKEIPLRGTIDSEISARGKNSASLAMKDMQVRLGWLKMDVSATFDDLPGGAQTAANNKKAMAVTLKNTEIMLAGGKVRLPNSRLSGRMGRDSANRIEFTALQANIRDTLDLQGVVQFDPAKPLHNTRGKASGTILNPVLLMQAAAAYSGKKTAPVEISSGKVDFFAEFSGMHDGKPANVVGKLVPKGLRVQKGRIAAALNGTIPFTAEYTPEEGMSFASQGSLEAYDVQSLGAVNNLQASWNVLATKAQYIVDTATLTLKNAHDSRAEIDLAGSLARKENNRLEAGKDSHIRINKSRFEVSGWKAPTDQDNAAGLSVTGKAVHVKDMLHLIGVVSGLPAEEWSADGTLSFKAGYTPGSTGDLSLQCDIREASFSSPDGRILSAGLNARLDASGSLIQNTWKAGLSIPKGEFLYDTMYLNAERFPVNLRIETEELPKGPALRHFKGSLGELIVAEAQGVPWAESEEIKAEVSVRLNDFGRLYEDLVKEPLAVAYPAARTTTISGAGRLEGLVGYSSESVNISGLLSIQGMDVSFGKKVEADEKKDESPYIRGLHLELPLDYEFRTRDEKAEQKPGQRTEPQNSDKWGTLRIDGIYTTLGEPKPLETDVVVASNRLLIGRPDAGAPLFEADILGGNVVVWSVEMDRPFSSEYVLSALVSAERLDLSKIESGIPISGMVSMPSGVVALTEEGIRPTKNPVGTLYGGGLEISDIRILNPFASDRRIQADVKVSRLDLEQMSTAMGFGRITGVMSAAVMDLEVVYGQPSRFLLRAWSVDAQDAEKKVSLKAVNSISVMGTGTGLTGVAAGLFATFFKEFAYKSIGIGCTLENDVFQVRGLIRENGIEYLIKKPFLFGINVINSNPENTIGFSDMKERLKRVLAPKGEAGRHEQGR